MANEKPKKSGADSRTAAVDVQRGVRRRNRRNPEEANWGNADASLVLRVITAISGRGCAVQFGYSKDGGSFHVRIVGDGEPYSEYTRPTEDINYYLTALEDDFLNGSAGEG